MISHTALVTTIAGCNQYLESFNETLGPDDAYLSFLPLAHVFDRSVWRSTGSLPAAIPLMKATILLDGIQQWMLACCQRSRIAGVATALLSSCRLHAMALLGYLTHNLVHRPYLFCAPELAAFDLVWFVLLTVFLQAC